MRQIVASSAALAGSLAHRQLLLESDIRCSQGSQVSVQPTAAEASAPAGPAITLRVYTHGLPDEGPDFGFLDFSASRSTGSQGPESRFAGPEE